MSLTYKNTLSLIQIENLMRRALSVSVEEYDKMEEFTEYEFKLAKQMKICFCVTLFEYIDTISSPHTCNTNLLTSFCEADEYKIVLFFRYLWDINQIDNYRQYVFGHHMKQFANLPFITNINDKNVYNLWDLTDKQDIKDAFIIAFNKQKNDYKEFCMLC